VFFDGYRDTIRVWGLATDADTDGPVAVHIYVDDDLAGDVFTGSASVGVSSGYFSTVLPLDPGSHRICAYAIDDQRGRNTLLACQQVRTSGTPVGKVYGIETYGNEVHVSGFAYDADTPDPSVVHTYVDGILIHTTLADRTQGPREVGTPTSLGNGFHLSFVTSPGRHRVCVSAADDDAGTVLLACRFVDVGMSDHPVGVLHWISASRSSLTISGWASDPDTPDPIVSHIYLDGEPVLATRAWNGELFATIPAQPGRHRVCAYAIDNDGLQNSRIGCLSASVQYPYGWISSVELSERSVTISGVAFDPDTNNPVFAHFYVDDVHVAAVLADGSVEFLGEHGYSISMPLAPGTHRVCVYAIDNEHIQNSQLGCRSVDVVNHRPTGTIDRVDTTTDSLTVHGWAHDPDTSNPIPVHIYLDGKIVTGVLADTPRPDLNLAKGIDGNHGFSITIPFTQGTHRVCVFGIDNERIQNSQLGCESIALTDP
jgi:hypothetical protein